MHKRIKVFLGICSLTLLLCTGCASTLQEEMDTHLKPGLVEYDMPDDLEYQAAVEAENTVKKLAEQENVPPSLSDDFIQKYLDMSSFEELKQRTLEGIQITNDMANMPSAEISLWHNKCPADVIVIIMLLSAINAFQRGRQTHACSISQAKESQSTNRSYSFFNNNRVCLLYDIVSFQGGRRIIR